MRYFITGEHSEIGGLCVPELITRSVILQRYCCCRLSPQPIPQTKQILVSCKYLMRTEEPDLVSFRHNTGLGKAASGFIRHATKMVQAC